VLLFDPLTHVAILSAFALEGEVPLAHSLSGGPFLPSRRPLSPLPINVVLTLAASWNPSSAPCPRLKLRLLAVRSSSGTETGVFSFSVSHSGPKPRQDGSGSRDMLGRGSAACPSHTPVPMPCGRHSCMMPCGHHSNKHTPTYLLRCTRHNYSFPGKTLRERDKTTKQKPSMPHTDLFSGDLSSCRIGPLVGHYSLYPHMTSARVVCLTYLCLGWIPPQDRTFHMCPVFFERTVLEW